MLAIKKMSLVTANAGAGVAIIPLMEWISTIFQFVLCKILKNTKSFQKKNSKSNMNFLVVVNKFH